ncbi:MAG: aspartyl/asparaginyl beta-hydroxylase domain-containing protein [Myxococcota bacterium]
MDDPATIAIAYRLPLAVDALALARDADRLGPDDWVLHFNTRYFEGDWSGAAFRAPGGNAQRLYPDLTGRLAFADTPLMARCPAVAELVGRFACPLAAVRFLRLGPGARILPHRDYDLGFDRGEVRVHVPVRTDPAVRFIVGGTALAMQPGEAWYADFGLTHEVENRSATARIHLVLDCGVNDWLRAQLAGASAVVARP